MIKAGGSSEMGQFLAHFATIVSIGHRPPCNHCRKNFQKQSKATLPPTRATRKLQCCYFWQIFQPCFTNFQKYFNPALQTFKNISALLYKLLIMLDFWSWKCRHKMFLPKEAHEFFFKVSADRQKL